MKKNFLKKLSFVMALAMIVSLVAPAAGVFAATSPALNATSKTLLLGSADRNDFDFNITNRVSGSKYAWSSDNEAVATVDENGLTTAVGVGTTKVTVVITKKDGKTVTRTATVVVKDNIKEISEVYLQTKDAATDKLAANTEYDFGRKFVTVSGSTTKTTSVTRWFVDSDKATVDKNGVFKATEAGTYKLTAVAFQSTAKYDAWAALKDTTSTVNVLATKTVEVTVIPGVVSTKQVNTTKFDVTFDTDMTKSDVKTASAVYQIINGKQVSTGTEKIKAITLDAAGKVATVEMYAAFNPKTEYNFVYGKLVGRFTAASTSLADVDSIVFDDFNVSVNGNQALAAKVSGLNKDGVVILTGSANSDFAAALSFTYDGELGKCYYDSNAKTLYTYTKGYAAPLTATFTYSSYDTEKHAYNTVTKKDGAVATCVETDTSLNASTLQYVLVAANGTTPASDNAAWTTPITIAAKDSGYHIVARYKNNDATSTTAYSVDDLNANAFIYEPANADKLLVQGDYIVPLSEGVATVIVKKNDTNKTVVGTFDITVAPVRTFVSATIDKPEISVGNNASYGDNGTATLATILCKDSMGDTQYASVVGTPTVVNKPSTTAVAPVVTANAGVTSDDKGKVFVKVDSRSATAGAYQFKVKVNTLSADKEVNFYVIVGEGNTADTNTAVSWRVDLSDSSIDLKEAAAAKDVTIEVNGYNNNGVKVAKLDSAQYKIEVKTGDTLKSTDDTNIPVISGVSGSALSMYDVNTYIVTAYVTLVSGQTYPITGRVDGSFISSNIFTVKDSTTKTFGIDSTVVAPGSVLTAVKNAFNFTLNGTKLTDTQEANIVEVKYSTGAQAGFTTSTGAEQVATGTNLYVEYVKYKVDNTNGTSTVYTFNLGQTIKIQ